MTNPTPIRSQLVLAAAQLVRVVPGVTKVFVNPSAWSDVENSIGLGTIVAVVRDVSEKITARNEIRAAAMNLQVEIYIKADISTTDPATGLWLSDASQKLDDIWAAANRMILTPQPQNTILAIGKKVVELALNKYLEYDDFAAIVSNYEIGYFTARLDPYAMLEGLR